MILDLLELINNVLSVVYMCVIVGSLASIFKALFIAKSRYEFSSCMRVAASLIVADIFIYVLIDLSYYWINCYYALV